MMLKLGKWLKHIWRLSLWNIFFEHDQSKSSVGSGPASLWNSALVNKYLPFAPVGPHASHCLDGPNTILSVRISDLHSSLFLRLWSLDRVRWSREAWHGLGVEIDRVWSSAGWSTTTVTEGTAMLLFRALFSTGQRRARPARARWHDHASITY
ncbi:hypothetical protein Dimus_006136 [Dionaea muscipula]